MIPEPYKSGSPTMSAAQISPQVAIPTSPFSVAPLAFRSKNKICSWPSPPLETIQYVPLSLAWLPGGLQLRYIRVRR